jgi:hypothetical protein
MCLSQTIYKNGSQILYRNIVDDILDLTLNEFKIQYYQPLLVRTYSL